MNKEQAEIYVIHSTDSSKTTSRKFQNEFLLINLICSGIAVALHHELIFVTIISIVAISNIIFTFLFAKREAVCIKVAILMIIQLIVFWIVLNCIVFGIYKVTDRLVLWEFIASVAIQLIAFGISFVFIIKHAKKFMATKGITKIELTAGIVAGLSFSLALIFCRILSPSLNTFVTIMAILINLMSCLVTVGIAGAFYRVYLIKKYNLNSLRGSIINGHQDITGGGTNNS